MDLFLCILVLLLFFLKWLSAGGCTLVSRGDTLVVFSVSCVNMVVNWCGTNILDFRMSATFLLSEIDRSTLLKLDTVFKIINKAKTAWLFIPLIIPRASVQQHEECDSLGDATLLFNNETLSCMLSEFHLFIFLLLSFHVTLD